MQRSQFNRRGFIKNALASTIFATSFPIIDAPSLYGAQPASDDALVADSPYGVCAHISIGDEWDEAPKNLQLMKEAGIRWVRTDFLWSETEKSQGNWSFEKLDKIVDETNRLGLQILPILDYEVPWGSPAFQHLDEWLTFVKAVVGRYRDKIRHWEVWNEENADYFWHSKANGADYATLLIATYKAIKEIDPSLIVLYGGLSGVPCDFFEASLDAGAGEYFDVINIHPYRGGIISATRVDNYQREIENFRVALKKRNIQPKPVWITEMGWATPPSFGRLDFHVLNAALTKLSSMATTKRFANKNPKIALFYDDRYDPSTTFPFDDFLILLPEVYRQNRDLAVMLNADEVLKIGETDVEVLVMPPSETFPADCLPTIVEFVKNGGVLVLSGGAPLYYESWIGKSGRYEQGPHNPNFIRDLDSLRISWFAWWTRQGVPEITKVAPAPEALNLISPEDQESIKKLTKIYDTARFFDDAKLKDGDVMIPLLNGIADGFTEATACLYDFNSDYKGAVIISGVYCETGANSNTSTVENQAVYLTQALLLSFAFGVDKYFWYEFQAPEQDDTDKEHHFGIVGQKLDPKPAYFAYKTLTKARPASSKEDALKSEGNYCIASWKRPDGKKGWALWSYRLPIKVTLKIEGAVDEAFDYLGNDVVKPSNGEQIALIPGSIFLIGPDNIAIE